MTGSNGELWETSDLIDAHRLNWKTILISVTDPTNTLHEGAVWIDTSGGECLLKFRNKANGAWLDYFDQAVKQASGPTFDHLHITNNIVVGGTVDGVDIAGMVSSALSHITNLG